MFKIRKNIFGLLVGAVLLTAAQARPVRAYYNLPLLYWPLDDEYRFILSYPNTEWTWALLGLNPGYECPPYHRTSFADSWEYWRDPSLPLEEDWLQASQGNNRVACYSRSGAVPDHRGTDVFTPPGAPVYAVADGTIRWVEAASDDKGEDGVVEIDHRREFRDELYEWHARYVHLANVFPVPSGEVHAGQVIGFVANRGTNTHLHFEVDGLWDCVAPCIVNPFGPTDIWINYDDLGGTDPATDALLTPPADKNLVRNGGFGSGFEGWVAAESVEWRIDKGMLHVWRRAGERGSWVRQYLPYKMTPGTPVEITLRLGNESDRTKWVGVSVHALDSWIGYVGCTFMVPSGSPLQTYRVRGPVGGRWLNVVLQVSVYPADGVPSVLVDSVGVRYRPEMDVSERECILPE